MQGDSSTGRHRDAVPFQAVSRPDDGALTWATSDASLAPLAPGDYAIRTTITRGSKTDQVITAFRLVPYGGCPQPSSMRSALRPNRWKVLKREPPATAEG